MSPTSNRIEALCARHGVQVLEAQEFYLTRVAYRKAEHGWADSDAETAALADLEIWCRLWVQLKGEVGPQLRLKSDRESDAVHPDASRHDTLGSRGAR